MGRDPSWQLPWSGLALAVGSVVIALLLAELTLRTVLPRYADAAETRRARDPYRIWAPEPNTAEVRLHPDTGLPHLILHNNLALRQHRDIAPEKAPGVRRVGCFGDSFTENRRVAGPHSYPEVLDFLLNRHGDSFEVPTKKPYKSKKKDMHYLL